MISKSTRCMFATATGALSELPVVEGSETRRSDTVTEWNVQEGFYTDTVDPATGRHALAQITKVSRHTGLRMYDCSLSVRGSYRHMVTASDDHSLITLNPNTMELDRTRPDESVGRLVPRVLFNQGNDWSVCAKYIRIGRDIQATHEVGFVIGAILGDGWVDTSNCLRIACCNESLKTYLLELLRRGATPIPLTKDATAWEYDTTPDRFSKNKAQRITIYADTAFKRDLRELIGAGACNKRIPEDCMMASRAHLSGILMGLLATDGSVNYSEGTKTKKTCGKTVMIHTTSPLLRDGIQELCLRLGIKTGATVYRGPHSTMDCYAVTLSIVDLAREIKRHPAMYRIHHAEKDEALRKITLGVENLASSADYDIVPLPVAIRSELIYAGANVGPLKSPYSSGIAAGSTSRRFARQMADLLKEADWEHYKEPRSVYARMRTHHTPDQARELVGKWVAIVENSEIAWETVDEVTPAACTEGWDCTVPGPYTFTLSTGTVVQDTVNIHVPVSDNARREALERMTPSANLISAADRKIYEKPEKEYIQGLYIATRMGKSPDGRARIFRTLSEAREAYRNGAIDVDTPIQITEKDTGK